MLSFITRLFPLWAILGAIWAYLDPNLFASYKPYIVPLLGLVMLGMGMTLTFDNFKQVLHDPKRIAIGCSLQFLLMPLLAWLIATLLQLPTMLAVGLILVGSCPGGTASNVICFLAKGDVALSISITTLSTLLAVFATPLLTWLYASQMIFVPIIPMLLSIAKIVILPVCSGLLINTYFGQRLKTIKAVFPLVSVFAIVFIIAIIIGLTHDKLQQLALGLVIAVILHNLSGLISAYWLSRWLGYDLITSRTLAIEVGMQNSGLAATLAISHLSAIAALPASLFSLWHNLSGSIVAGYWRNKGNIIRK